MKKTTKLISMILAIATVSSLMTCSVFAESILRPATKGKAASASSKATSTEKSSKAANETVAPAEPPSRNPADYPLLNVPELIIVDWETPATIFMEMYSEKDGTTFYFYANKGEKSMSYLGETKFDEVATTAYLAEHPNRPLDMDDNESCSDSMQELLDEFNSYRGLKKEKFSNKTCLPTMEVPPSSYKYGPNAVLPTDMTSSGEQTVDTAAYATKVIELINQERKAAGKSALKEKATLTTVANTRAKEISTKFSHTRPNGGDVGDLVKGYEWLGENLAAGQSTPEAVVKAWMASKGHKSTLLSENFSKTGVSCYQGADGKFYWVQVFSD